MSATLPYAVLPATLEVSWQQESGLDLLRTAARHGFTFFLMFCCLLLSSRLPFSVLWGGLCAVLCSAYLLVLWALLGYWWWTGHQFDLMYALDAGVDAWSTLWRTYGLQLVLLLGVTAFGFGAVFWFWLRALRWLREQRPHFFPSFRLLLPLGLAVLTVWYALGERPLVWAEVGSALAWLRGEMRGAPIFPHWEPLPTLREESVFVLQLESGNAIAISGTLSLDGRRYDGDYMPQLRALQKEGVWFPYVWANSVQTNRALENLLCGIDNNMGQALSYTPHKIVVPCLPELLKRAGYRTLLFVGFDDLSFMNYRNFAEVLGFEEVWDSRLAGRWTTYDWGIDDCQFYRAVFEHLQAEHRGQKLFVWIGVSSHHYPFSGRARYADLHPFRLPQTFVEWFLNSWVEQDHCLDEFSRLFRDFASPQTHWFLTPDHAWPVGLHGNTFNDAGWFNENFLVPLLYIPPTTRRHEFRVGETIDQRPGLSDLPATILDLLGDRRVGNSFAHLLRKEGSAADYEDCHLLVQPYGRRSVAIVRGSEKVVYHARERVLEKYDLEADPEEREPILLATDISYEEVREKYYCFRHRRQSTN